MAHSLENVQPKCCLWASSDNLFAVFFVVFFANLLMARSIMSARACCVTFKFANYPSLFCVLLICSFAVCDRMRQLLLLGAFCLVVARVLSVPAADFTRLTSNNPVPVQTVTTASIRCSSHC